MNGKKRAKSYSFHDINEMGHRYLGFYTSEIEGSKALFYSTPPPGVTLQKRVTDLNYILDIASTVVEEDKEFVMEQWVEPVSEALDIINNAIPSKCVGHTRCRLRNKSFQIQLQLMHASLC